MSVKSEQSLVAEFITRHPDTGAAVNADSLPTVVLTVNGVNDAASVTVASKATGEYTASAMLPVLAAGDVVALIRTATIAGVLTKEKVFEAVADTVHLSDVQTSTKRFLQAVSLNLLFGQEWEQLLVGSRYWDDVRCSADGQCIIASYTPVEATAAPGFVLSRDGGTTWTTLDILNDPYQPAKASMSADGQTILLGASGNGLWLSTDGGDNFTQVNDADTTWLDARVSDDGAVLFAARGQGYYLSTDGGENWVGPVKPAGETSSLSRGAMSPDGTYLLVTASAPSIRVWMSDNQGSSWTDITPTTSLEGESLVGVVWSQCAKVDNWGYVYLIGWVDDEYTTPLYSGCDWEGWVWWVEEPGIDSQGAQVAVDGDGTNFLYFTTDGLWLRRDYAEWLPVCPEPPLTDANALCVAGEDSEHVLVGSYRGGISKWVGAVAGTKLNSDYDAAKTAASASTAALIKLKTDLISAGHVTVVSPVSSSGDITIFAGDDYYQSEGRSIPLDIPDPTHMYQLDQPGAVTQLRLQQATWDASQVVPTATGYTTHFQPSDAQTGVLTRSQPYQLHCMSPNGHEFTLHEAMAIVAKVLPAVV
ncbi:MAG: exo-alpha-sialidase [Thermoleophilia bacterium]|nr:exo-alpha-sialidase [Thermoleophilia bacterium]